MMEVDENTHKKTLMSTLHNLLSGSGSVKKLMGWRCIDDDKKWAEKAVETLVKKLKKKRGAIDELRRAVSNPDAPSRCVTIPRSADGRLQVSHRKALPHVIYCKLWRWSDLRSHHELRALPCCEFPFHAKTEEICVNPYHYRRVVSPFLPDVHVSKQPLQEHEQQQNPPPRVPEENCVGNARQYAMPKNVTMPDHPEVSSPGFWDDAVNYLQESTQQHERAADNTQHQPPQQNHIENPDYPDYRMPVNSEAIPYREMCCWATITYYELNCRVGEPFQCTQTVVSVDGYTSPVHDSDRFCLGKLSNVNRNSVIESVRQHIGQGVTFHYAGGDVFAECTSSGSIFVQSRICNYQNNLNLTDVIKVKPGMTLKIFDTTLFGNILNKVVPHGFSAAYDLIKMCTIRLSFVKGWGADYHRVDVTATPCWIEITLNGPLKWLDNVLTGMGSPANAISSVS